MHPAIQSVKNAIGYAKFSNPELKDQVLDTLDKIGIDLESEEYETPADVDEALVALDTTLNELDESDENLNAAIGEGLNEDDELNEDEDDK